MSEKRAHADREQRERERFSDEKRDLFLEALAQLSSTETVSFDNSIGMTMSLSLFDTKVAVKYTKARNSHHAAFESMPQMYRTIAREVGAEVVAEVVAEVAAGNVVRSKEEVSDRARMLAKERLPHHFSVDDPKVRRWMDDILDLTSEMRRSLGVSGDVGAIEMTFRSDREAKPK
jgi:hypothetical protein